MLILATILILLTAAAGLTLWRILQPGFGYAWIVASIGALLAWVSALLWQLRLPIAFAPTLWQRVTLLTTSPALQADGVAWAFAVALTTMCLAAVLTAPLRALPVNALTLAGTLTLTAIGVIAVTAQNPLTLVIAWGALDLAELAIILRTFETERQNDSAVFAFAIRSAGIGLLVWANVYSRSLGTPLDFNLVPPQVSVILLLAAAFRLGVLPTHLPYAGAPVLRRGFGSVIRLVSAAASLILLARLPQGAVPSTLAPWLFLFIGATALFAGWRWFRATDEMTGRPYWIIGMGALAVSAALSGNNTGSAALGLLLILLGSLVFFHSHATRPASLVMLVALLTGLGLPLTLSATAWVFIPFTYWWMWPLMLGAHVLLMTGWARFTLMERPALPEEQAWQNIVYPLALGALGATTLLLGMWGWEGGFQPGTWWLGLLVATLTGSLIWLRLRLKILAGGQSEPELVRGRPLVTLDQLSAGAWSLYYGARHVSTLIAQTLEGDGGILWTLLLLVLFITLVQGAR